MAEAIVSDGFQERYNIGDVAVSNHTGGYLLNYAFHRLVENGFVDRFGKQKAQEIVLDVIEFATRQYDCNEGEILNELGKELGICYYCLQPASEIKRDVCLKCRQEGGWGDDDEEEEELSPHHLDESKAFHQWIGEVITNVHKQRRE